MAKLQDLTGQKFNRLTVISLYSTNPRTTWNCLCDCGNKKIVQGKHLKTGNSKSCGCLQKESQLSSHSTHNLTLINKNLYKIWKGMIARCSNKKNSSFKYYGGKGIIVYSEWMNGKIFFEWALNNGYKTGLTIERIDVNKNYQPENCKWIPLSKQPLNRSSTLGLAQAEKIKKELISGAGVSSLSDKYHVSKSTIYRIKNGTIYLVTF